MTRRKLKDVCFRFGDLSWWSAGGSASALTRHSEKSQDIIAISRVGRNADLALDSEAIAEQIRCRDSYYVSP